MNDLSINTRLRMEPEPQTLEKKVRDANIELGRVCCFASIVGSHMLPLHSYDFNVIPMPVVIVGVCCKMFVTPFFFLTMGAFMSSGTPYRKQLVRVIKKIVIPFVFIYFLLLQFMPLAKRETGILGTLTELHVNLGEFFWSLATASFEHYEYMGHLWFIGSMFLCYLLLPVFGIFLYDSPIDKMYKRNVVIIGIVVFVIPGTLKAFCTDAHVQRMTAALPEFPFFWIWLMLLGSYIHGWMRRNKNAVTSYVIWLAPIAFFAFGVFNFHFTRMYDLKPDLTVARNIFTWHRQNVMVFLPNLLPFIWFHCIRIKNTELGKIILYASDKCFYMYLIHLSVFALFKHYIDIDANNRSIAHFLHWLLIVLLSFAIACVLKYVERRMYSSATKLWSKIIADGGSLSLVFRRRKTGGGGLNGHY